MTHEFREAWLNDAVGRLANTIFAAEEIEVPPVRISVGFPGGRNKKSTTIGQCWNSKAAEDKVHQIFIHPSLKDPVEILATIVHELIHAVDDCEHGHKGPFTKMIRAVGLEGKPTATRAGEELRERLQPIIEQLGEFPHAALAALGGGGQSPKQTTRMLKAVCAAEGSEYKVRLSRKMIDEYGCPICPCHELEMIMDAEVAK